MRPLWTESRLISWENIRAALESLPGDDWVFRGHERTEWELQTTLERTFGPVKRFDEEDLLLQFVRRAPRFLPSNLVPADDDHAAWLGLLQHYGGPTRLLDVSLSPYVALFFAFESAGEHDRSCGRLIQIGASAHAQESWQRRRTRPTPT